MLTVPIMCRQGLVQPGRVAVRDIHVQQDAALPDDGALHNGGHSADAGAGQPCQGRRLCPGAVLNKGKLLCLCMPCILVLLVGKQPAFLVGRNARHAAVSKVKRFLRMVCFIMGDTLRTLVLDNHARVAGFVQGLCATRVSCTVWSCFCTLRKDPILDTLPEHAPVSK